MHNLIVEVPLNTAIADLDDALRLLLRQELVRHGFDGVEIAFDAPSRDWSAKLTGPAVDLFLYDLREAAHRAELTPTERRANGRATLASPPMQLELSYAVTAWTKAVEDEHRLLSQVVAILHTYRRVPPEVLAGQLHRDSSIRDAEICVGRPREAKADFWTSIGGQYKASIDVTLVIPIASGATTVRGPEVRTQTIRTRLSSGPAQPVAELHRLAGIVKDETGAPVANAWVTLPECGQWTATDGAGRFVLHRLAAGDHSLVVRTPAGRELATNVTVPGARADLVVDSHSRRAASRRRRV